MFTLLRPIGLIAEKSAFFKGYAYNEYPIKHEYCYLGTGHPKILGGVTMHLPFKGMSYNATQL